MVEAEVEEVLEEDLGVPDQDHHHLPQDQVDQDHPHGHQVLDQEATTITNPITAHHTGKERKDIIQHTTS